MSLSNILNSFLTNNSFIKNVTIIAGGAVIAQGFTMATMPIISRIYSPSDFGILALFTSFMSILIPLSSLQYYLAIALPKSQRHSDTLLCLSFLLELVNCSIIFIIIVLGGDSLLSCLGMTQISMYKFLIPFAVFGASAYDTLVQLAIREKLFVIIARTKATQSVSGGVTKIILGLCGYKPLGLITGTIVGQIGGITSIAKAVYKKRKITITSYAQLKRVALKYRNFPIFSTPTAIINITGEYIIPILIFNFYGAAITGYFSIAQQLLVIPSVFIGNAIGQVFLQKASVAKHEGGLQEVTLKTYMLLLRVGIYPTLLIAFFSPIIFSFVLGNTWKEAGYYARCLIPLATLSFAFSPISHVFNILNKQKLAFKLEILYFLSKICAFLIVTLYHSPLVSISLLAISGGSLVILRTFFVLNITGIKFSEICTKVCKIFGAAIALFLVNATVWYSCRNLAVFSVTFIVTLGMYAYGVYRSIQL